MSHTLFVLPKWCSLPLMSFSLNYTIAVPRGVAVLGLRFLFFCLFFFYVSLVGAKSSPRKIPLRICWGEGDRGGAEGLRGSLSREEASPAEGWGTASVARAGLVTKGKTEGFDGCWNSCYILSQLRCKKV